MVKIFTDEMRNFLIQNQEGKTRDELTFLFNENFNVNFSPKQIKNFCGRNHLFNNIPNKGRFKSNNTPWNKGKKMPEEFKAKLKAAKLLFEKGNKPVNSLPIGTERIAKDGYIEIKVDSEKYKTAGGRGNVLAEHTKWIPKQRKIWIDHHGDSIPKNSLIVFLDKNKLNFDINNLYCINRNIHATMCHKGRYTENAGITNLSINLTKLEKTIIKRKKIKIESEG